jgi:hypothetical protein
VATRLASDSAILRRVSDELGEVRRLSGIEGWTDALAARALAALRVVATYALARPVTQVRDHGMQPFDGQLAVPARWLGPNAALVSGSVTSVMLTAERRRIEAHRAIAERDAGGAGSRVERLADLDGAMSRFSGKAYGRNAGSINDADLDEAFDVGRRELDRLRREHGWLAKKLRALGSGLLRLTPHTTAAVARATTRPMDRS